MGELPLGRCQCEHCLAIFSESECFLLTADWIDPIHGNNNDPRDQSESLEHSVVCEPCLVDYQSGVNPEQSPNISLEIQRLVPIIEQIRKPR